MAKTFVGTVSSTKSHKTIVVTVTTSKTHPVYNKRYSVSKKFMAHDEKSEAQSGDTVQITETPPYSAHKRFKLVKVIERPMIREESEGEA